MKQSISRSNGLTLHWDHPSNPNGELLYYSIEWNGKDGNVQSKNVSISEVHYKFPNSIDLEKINITIRAVSSFGEGVPVYINLSNLNALGNISPKNEFDPTLGIALGLLLSFVCVCFCVFCFILKDRTCKKNNRNAIQNRSLPPLQSLTHCTTDVHEMQTLINKTTKIELIPNGHEKPKTLVERSNVKNVIIENDVNKSDDEQIEKNNLYVEKIPPAPDDNNIIDVSSYEYFTKSHKRKNFLHIKKN